MLAVVGATRHALQVVEAGIDMVVAQGHDGGGHNSPIGTMALIPQVVDAVGGRVPVLGAGGIGDGRGVAAALMLGAEGAWIGTAFLATEEAGISDAQKRALVEGNDEGTTVSRSVTGKPARMVKNRWARAYAESGLEPLPMPWQGTVSFPVTAAATAAGRADVWGDFAGQGLGHGARGAAGGVGAARHRGRGGAGAARTRADAGARVENRKAGRAAGMDDPGSGGDGAVLFELAAPRVALVTINRPDARNAVNGAVAQGLEAAVERVEADPEIWAAVLTGAGPHAFCAGADLKEVSAGRSATLATEKGGFAGFVRAERSKLWIAAAQGHALAGGLELLLACDLAVAAETATFGLPEVKRSLVAAAGGVFRLPRALPKAVALQMIATGEPIPAARAAQLGLVNEVVPAAEVRRPPSRWRKGLRQCADRGAGEPGHRPAGGRPGPGRALGAQPRRQPAHPRDGGFPRRAARLRGEAAAALDGAVATRARRAGAGREEAGCTGGIWRAAWAGSPPWPRRACRRRRSSGRSAGRAARSRWSPASARAPART